MRIGGSGAVTLSGREWESVARSQTFAGYGSPVGVAAEYAKLQIFNPVASGVIVYVTNVFNVNDAITLAPLNTALATAVATLASKLLGATAPMAELYREAEVALTAGDFLNWQFGGSTTTERIASLAADPIVLAQGTGLVQQNLIVNNGMTCGFEWVEVPI